MKNVIMIYHGKNFQNKNKQTKPFIWIKNLFNKYKKNQDELTQRKIEFLKNEMYDYYLTLIINRKHSSEKIDLYPAIYEAREAMNPEAKSLSEEAIISVIKDGRVEECYSKRVRELKKLGRKPAKKIFA